MIRLDQHRGIEGIDVEMLDAEALGIFALILRHFLKGRQQLMFKQMIDCLAFVDGAFNPDNILNRQAAVQRFCQLDDRVLAHAVQYEISTGIQKD